MDVDLRLYALLDPAVAGGRTLADLAGRIASSATLMQLRDKHGSTRAMMEEARALQAVLEPKGIPLLINCLLYTSPSPRDRTRSRMPSSA